MADKRTKAELIEALEEKQARVEELLARPEPEPPTNPKPVPEAIALAGCVRALDALTAPRRDVYGTTPSDLGAIPRILISLSDRYSAGLVKEQRSIEIEQPVHFDPEILARSIADGLRSGRISQGDFR